MIILPSESQVLNDGSQQFWGTKSRIKRPSFWHMTAADYKCNKLKMRVEKNSSISSCSWAAFISLNQLLSTSLTYYHIMVFARIFFFWVKNLILIHLLNYLHFLKYNRPCTITYTKMLCISSMHLIMILLFSFIFFSGWPYNNRKLPFTKPDYWAEWFRAASAGELCYLLFHMFPGINRQQKGG